MKILIDYMKKFRFTIRSKFAIIFALLIVLISAFIYFYFPLKLEREALKPIADKARSISHITAFSISSPLHSNDKKESYEVIESVRHDRDLVYLVIHDPLGEIFYAFNFPAASEADYRFRESEKPISADNLIYRTVTPVLHDGKQIGLLFLGVSLEGLRAQINRSKKTSAQVGAVVFILGMLTVFLISALVTRPLKRIVRTIDEIARGDLSRRADFSSNDEVGDLARSFNLMVDNLENVCREMSELNRTLEQKVDDRTRELQAEVNERKQTQRVLAEEKERLAVTLRSIGEGVIATDISGKITMMNKAAERLTGWSMAEAMGKSITGVFHIFDKKAPDRRQNPVGEVLKTSKIVELSGEIVLHDKTGREVIISVNTAPIYDRDNQLEGTVLVFRDITEKKRIEAELLKMQKLESIELLAGGIAHDFNNIMTAILGNIDLIKLQSDPQSPNFEKLIAAESAVKRAQALTRQLLTFSRAGTPVKTPVSISELIKETVNFTLSGSNVHCQVLISADLGAVECDPDQISLVFNNILINAQQAMPDGGTIEVNASNVEITDQYYHHLEPGQYVKIMIRDHGIGIDEEKLTRIFDPFYTDKPSGSGLGLSTSYSIIKKHNGFITVESQKGEGTTFYIYLPAGKDPLAREDKMKRPIPRGKGRILLMDDEEMVLETGGKILEFLGYETAFARDGVEAIKIFREARESGIPFHGIIMDLTIPGGMGGKEAARQIKAIDPDIKIIVSSGYALDNLMEDYRDFGFSGVLSKPYLVEEISEILNRVLGDETLN